LIESPGGITSGSSGPYRFRQKFENRVSVTVELEATLITSKSIEDDHVDFNAELELVAA